MKKTSEWIFSQEIPSDVTVQVGGVSFSLHKFPLVSKCGYLRRLVSESSNAEISVIELPDLPGGAKAFESAAKFCYGVNFEISIENIATLRCVAEYLDMTEEYFIGNLVGKTEDYFNEVAIKSLSGAVSVLHASENLLPTAEKVKLVSRCIDAIAYYIAPNESPEGVISKSIDDWWEEDLSVLRIDIFQKVLVALTKRGLKQYALVPLLMLYAHKSLRGSEIFEKGGKKIEPHREHEKRVILETMLDLEKRIGLQLGQVVLDDLLIPSYSLTGDTLFDVDTVKRILMNFLEYEVNGKRINCNLNADNVSPSMGDVERVWKVIENYLAEIASDHNLTILKFISIAELVPKQSRVNDDGMYRAVDIYLKAHPTLSDMDKRKVCSLMDFQKLSREACAHAAQNDRLPSQTVVQILYHEQHHLCDVKNGSHASKESPLVPSKLNTYTYTNNIRPVAAKLSNLRRENEELKLELEKLKIRLKDIENSSLGSAASSPQGSTSTTPSMANKPPLPHKSLMNSVSKRLGRLSPFLRADIFTSPNSKGRTNPRKDRRHSLS